MALVCVVALGATTGLAASPRLLGSQMGFIFPPLNWGFYLDNSENVDLKLMTSIKVSIYNAVLEWIVLVGGVVGKLLSQAL